MKKHVKKASSIKEIQVSKDYAGTERSPYRDWLEKTGDFNQEHEAPEPPEANPDVLPETAGLYHLAECQDERLDILAQVVPTLTERQQEILRMVGNEGRTLENTAAILHISKGTVQKTLERVRSKILSYEKEITAHKREGQQVNETE